MTLQFTALAAMYVPPMQRKIAMACAANVTAVSFHPTQHTLQRLRSLPKRSVNMGLNQLTVDQLASIMDLYGVPYTQIKAPVLVFTGEFRIPLRQELCLSVDCITPILCYGNMKTPRLILKIKKETT